MISYQSTSYLPETDTFFLPYVVGGPLEVLASQVENDGYIAIGPQRVWDFRESALKELRETGKLHWRR